MKPITAEWVAKAEGDFLVARREFNVTEGTNYDAVCFHAQQCVEKYLKARLVEDEKSFPRIHDLAALLDLVLPIEPCWFELRVEVDWLTDLAVEIRYPGTSAEIDDARKALAIAERTRLIARQALIGEPM